MHSCVFLLLSMTFGLVSSLPNPILRVENLDITVINKGLDLFEGDIKTTATKTRRRRSIRSTLHRWPLPVPYDLDWSLDMNAKGVILRAFEQFRLKTCVDFRPQFWNEQHIEIKKALGCWSQVGKNEWEQELSIGSDCDTVATVEHELMHALGFWHEQSRYDRDNHISINWGNIEAGKEKNFEIRTNDTNSTMDTPYDYFSVMHYPKDAFSNGKGSTIITKLPEFQDVIGQRLDMSHYDVEELNKFYRCNESISFLDHCSFDDDMCGMSVCSKSSVRWERVRRAVGGPHSDHTLLDTHSQGFFMHFSTKRGRIEDSAKMETRRMTPRRSCKVQCLEFFYYHSGSWSDQLNIWIREFDGLDDMKGTRRLMGQIKGSPADYWQLFHVPLNATKTFQVEFEARKGQGTSSGGFSVDDMNLSETECPHHTWQIRNFEGQLNANTNSSVMFSPKYYSSDDYSYQIAAVLTRDDFVVFARLVSGIFDDNLQWPCAWRQITFILLDQNPHIQKRMSKQSSITTSPSWITSQYFGRPSDWGSLNMHGFYYANKVWPHGLVMTTTQLRSRDFLKGGDAFLLISMKDISRLRYTNNLRCPTVKVKSISVSPLPPTKDDGPCGTKIPITTTSTHPPTTTTSSTTASTLRASDNSPVTPPERCNNIFSFTCYKTKISTGALVLVVLFIFIFGMLCTCCCNKTKRDVPSAENRVFMQMQ
ncbi:meprin A subunit beta-like [Alosa alosa]|uniref:meprin A subunit beta-like n=1 Tax=Alosa alosa TaxID=278164 RepID=UPI00201526C4|nr:meprin A subunit beta-like [Alosa alosa]XP_048117321.1 meprin A subunit beta-like [Alosa alosa]XP_048117322.1 meprin A subunit beta-like [Alosa alosa]XP_048117324.1 meprin A subunit beta-like [Alosa alosa]XP_048117325.1 meprin A subunit beta-like [Alosa alosa]XP_048117326.1 meprin A subunit beta-like [Alosa alosa]XP_048117327.1 meprin A subunit beta-like [Alosa alosa]